MAKSLATTLSGTPCLSNLIVGSPKTFFSVLTIFAELANKKREKKIKKGTRVESESSNLRAFNSKLMGEIEEIGAGVWCVYHVLLFSELQFCSMFYCNMFRGFLLLVFSNYFVMVGL